MKTMIAMVLLMACTAGALDLEYDGKSYSDCKFVSCQPGGVSYMHSHGIATIPLSALPETERAKYKDQVAERQELKRIQDAKRNEEAQRKAEKKAKDEAFKSMMASHRIAGLENQIRKTKERDGLESWNEVSFSSIRSNFEKMTDAQFEEYAKGLFHRKVRWTGWISNVDSKWLSDGYSVTIDMDAPGEWSVSEIFLSMNKSDALKLNKEQKVVFRGYLNTVKKAALGGLYITLDSFLIE